MNTFVIPLDNSATIVNANTMQYALDSLGKSNYFGTYYRMCKKTRYWIKEYHF